MKIAITGGAGNLGLKLARALSELDWADDIVLLDRKDAPSLPPKVRLVRADLLDAGDSAWRDHLREADAVVHLATVNAHPLCSWQDAAANVEITANVLAQIGQRPCRLVAASSSHVMSGYKEKRPAPATLTPDLPPHPAIKALMKRRLWYRRYRTFSAYGAGKLMAERLVRAAANASAGQLTAVSIRIGLVGHGDNRAADIARIPRQHMAAELEWLQHLWLSNRDYVAVMLAALLADAARWPEPAIIVNAMSNNAGMPWSLEATERLLDYHALDNFAAEPSF